MTEQIPLGYKKTEIGIIPEDWEVKRLGEIFDISAGGDVDKNDFSLMKTSKFRYPIYSNSLENNGLYGYSNIYEYEGNCITVTARGTLGVAIPRYEKFNAIIRLLVLRPKCSLDIKFISEFINEKVNFSIESTGVPQLTAPRISKYLVSLPTLHEQRAISRVLSDIDHLIESLDKLIEKKKLIKKGAMQLLLTGKKRLPGFQGEWVRKRLGEVALKIGTGSKNNEDKVENGKYPFFVRSDKIEKIDTYSYDTEAIIVPGEGKIGEIFHYIKGKFDAHQRVYVIREFKDVYGKYVYFYMQKFFGFHAFQYSVKATVDSLRLPTFLNFEMVLPPTLAEQRTIANILSDMDAEIEALVRKKKKYEMMKKGAMELLLTGKVRLKIMTRKRRVVSQGHVKVTK